MHMPVQHRRSVVLAFIKQHWVMAQNDQAVFVIDFCVLRNAFPIKTKLALDPVMIALNQMLVSVQLLQDLHAAFFVFPESVS